MRGHHHQVYSWQNKGKSAVMGMFQDGKLIIKAQDKFPSP